MPEAVKLPYCFPFTRIIIFSIQVLRFSLPINHKGRDKNYKYSVNISLRFHKETVNHWKKIGLL